MLEQQFISEQKAWKLQSLKSSTLNSLWVKTVKASKSQKLIKSFTPTALISALIFERPFAQSTLLPFLALNIFLHSQLNVGTLTHSRLIVSLAITCAFPISHNVPVINQLYAFLVDDLFRHIHHVVPLTFIKVVEMQFC